MLIFTWTTLTNNQNKTETNVIAETNRLICQLFYKPTIHSNNVLLLKNHTKENVIGKILLLYKVTEFKTHIQRQLSPLEIGPL